MINEFRRANMENSFNFERHLQTREDDIIFRVFADGLHQNLFKTRRALQSLFDFLELIPMGNKKIDNEKLSVPYRNEKRQQINDLVSFFIGVQRAVSAVIKGSFLLSEVGAGPRPTAEDILQNADAMNEEAKKLVVFCQSHEISPFEPDFLRSVLTTLGLEGFKQLVENEEFAVLRQNPDLFRQAMMHQQGDPVAFLMSKVRSVNEGIVELAAAGEFCDLEQTNPGIFAYAILHYKNARTSRGKHFSNAKDYLLFLKQEKEKAKAKLKKKGKRKRFEKEVY